MKHYVDNLLKDRAESINDIIIATDDYLRIAKDVLAGLDVAYYESMIEHVAVAKGCVAVVSTPVSVTFDDVTDIADIVNKFIALSKIDSIVPQIIALFSGPYSRSVVNSLGSSNASRAYNDSIGAQKLYQKYVASGAIDARVIEDVIPRMNLAAAKTYLSTNPTIINKLTIAMMGEQIKLSKGHDNEIASTIEAQKDEVLGGGEDYRRGTMPLITRHGLRPITPLIPIETARAGGALTITRPAPSFIMYDTRGLLDPEYIAAESLAIQPMSGLTKKVLKKYNTIFVAGPSQNYAENISGSGPIVIETFDNISARVLGPTGDTKWTSGQSLRPQKYNEICADLIIDACFDDKSAEMLAEFNTDTEFINLTDILRDEILDKLITWTKSRAGKIKSTAALREMMSNEELGDIVVNAFAAKVHPRDAEVATSYVVKWNDLAERFMREVEVRLNKVILNDKMFANTSEKHAREDVISVCKYTFENVLNDLDKARILGQRYISLKDFAIARGLS